MNPELEKPEKTKTCPECNGMGGIPRNSKDAWSALMLCLVCYGEGTVPVDEADARDDAAEARWEGRNGK